MLQMQRGFQPINSPAGQRLRELPKTERRVVEHAADILETPFDFFIALSSLVHPRDAAHLQVLMENLGVHCPIATSPYKIPTRLYLALIFAIRPRRILSLSCSELLRSIHSRDCIYWCYHVD
jgi:hypothetical protein